MIQKENIGGIYVIPSYESSFGMYEISSNLIFHLLESKSALA